ncbi:MAG: hypothetical protein CDV28_13026 [Candidatus Electronema aureum]|uniref:Uncharacterized protein n=1 Tax=Candidatus Electronema aureum TaxID=2005002 RepID=A0A521FZZ7_9BACT|nr:MAG: hypothetical protein CDV28_13026 [Candidatus Electronema aureum]
MPTDEILQEVRKNREAHAAKFNYDLRAIYEDLKKSEAEHIQSGCHVVAPPIHPPSADKSSHPTDTAPRHFALQRNSG